MNKKMVLDILVDEHGVIFSNNIPEILKKYFTNMETTIETMNLLTNNGEFYDIRCEFMKDENNYIVGNKMQFIFIGADLIITISSPLKKETLIIKEEFCKLREMLYHAFIKAKNIKYILQSKSTTLYSKHFKFYDDNTLVKDHIIKHNTIKFKEFSEFLVKEKINLNPKWGFSNIEKYSKVKNINIIEHTDIYPDYNRCIGIKEFIANKKDLHNFDKIIIDNNINEEFNNIELDEIDDLMYQTGILSLDEIKEALEKEKHTETVENNGVI